MPIISTEQPHSWDPFNDNNNDNNNNNNNDNDNNNNRCNLYSARIHSDGVLKALCIIITLALARRTPAHMAFQGINIPTRYPFTSPGLSAAQCG